MNSRNGKAHGSIYDTLFVARASRDVAMPSSTSAPRSVNLYDASQRRDVPSNAQQSVRVEPVGKKSGDSAD
jgi:hypothetical protein